MSRRSVVLEILVQDKNSTKVTSRLRKEFGAVERQAESATNAIQKGTKRARTSTRSYARAQSGANQVLFTYGDLINDTQQFQYGFSSGLRAIGNNIGFAAEQMSTMTTKTGGFRGTLKALGKSLLGPGGIILGINVAVTALSLLGDSMFSSKKETEELNVELKETKDFLTDIAKQKVSGFVESFKGTEQQLQAVNTAIDNMVGKLPEGVDLFKQMDEIVKQNKANTTQTSQATQDVIDKLEGEDRTLSDIQKRTLKILQNKQAELEAQKAIDEALDGILTKNKEQAAKGLDDLISANEKIIDKILNQQGDLTLAERKRIIALQEQNRELRAQIDNRRELIRLSSQQRPEGVTNIEPVLSARPTTTFGGFMDPVNSIEQLENRLKQLRDEWRTVDMGTEKFRRLKEQIRQAEQALREAKDEGSDFGDKTTEGLTKAETAMLQLTAAMGQLIGKLIEGQDEGIKFIDILKAALPIALSAAPGGQFLAPLVGGILSGFAHGTDHGFPGIGRVGERGEELLVAPPMSTIITNENVERMDRMRKEARTGANNIMAMNPGSLVQQIRQAMIEAQSYAPAPIVQLRRFDEGLKDERSIESAIGNEV